MPTPGNYILDVKTGTFDKQKHGLQVAGYASAINRTFQTDIDGGIVIHIHRDKPEKLSVHVYSSEELDQYYEDFIICAEAWWRTCANKQMREQFNKGVT